LGLGFLLRNDTGNLSLNGVLSPGLEGWPIYSTRFLSFVINGLAKWPAREVRNLFACLATDTRDFEYSLRPQPARIENSICLNRGDVAISV
jgi:hypothetical protein